ncbi:DUF7854 family protein [Halomicrobium urmianum]|uniref:DUF7854 family protein n=1 Tax=Halomicrobium urmianum TaxID=1586233 RepID=UPI001CD9208A|nr:hypothetical protein [Halomicrobium urmianum]
MDRISALRNVEDALANFEEGELSLAELEREVRGVLRTYATEFEGDLRAYRAAGETGSAGADGVVVVAASRPEARERVAALVDDPGRFEVEPVEGN